MYLGNLIEFQSSRRRHRSFRPTMKLQYHDDLKTTGLPFEVPGSCSRIAAHGLMDELISVVFDLSIRMVWIHVTLRYEGNSVPYRIEIPINFLRRGQVFTTTLGHTTPSQCVVMWLRCCPRIYRCSKSIALSNNKIWTTDDFLKFEWIRDYNPCSSIFGFGPFTGEDHPLKGFSMANAICIASSTKLERSMNNLRGHLSRAGMGRRGHPPMLELIPCDLGAEGRRLLDWFNRIRVVLPNVRIQMLLYELVANGYLANPFSMSKSRFIDEVLMGVRKHPHEDIYWVLREMIQRAHTTEPIWNVESMFQSLLHKAPMINFKFPKLSHCSQIFHFFVTPFRIHIEGPYPEISNRVIRNYQLHHSNVEERFYRVGYFEEDLTELHFSQTTAQYLAGRIDTIQRNGLYCFDGSRPYQLLGYSSSQLRSKSAWHFRDDEQGRILNEIWKSLGDFSGCGSRGKVAARLGQWFSSSHAIVNLSHEDEVTEVDDVECPIDFDHPEKGKFNFTDGIGFCSLELMESVRAQRQLNYTPSAIQIRYEGYKEMLSVFPQWFSGEALNPRPNNPSISIADRQSLKAVFRKSMRKFTVEDRSFEIIDYARFRPFHFNRQIIYALDSIGVKFETLNELQNDMILQMERCTESKEMAQEFLKQVGSQFDIWQTVYTMLECRLPLNDPFVMGVINTMRIYALRYLFSKSWIVSQNGANLYGISDETRTLKYDHGNGMPEVYLKVALRDEDPFRTSTFAPPGQLYKSFHCVNDLGGQKTSTVITGNVLIAKCPVMHPGDVQICYAIDHPELSIYENLVVFPQRFPQRGTTLPSLHPGYVSGAMVTIDDKSFLVDGFRDIPNMLSGSDLDGDQYHICWEPAIMQQLLSVYNYGQFPKPAAFYIPFKDTEEQSGSPPSLQTMLRENFINTALNNNLGLVAANHERLAHKPDVYNAGKGMNELCRQSAHYHSIAVDFPKTGKPALLPAALKVNDYPHFKPPPHITPNSDYTIYQSDSLLGKLYDSLRESESSVAQKSGRVVTITSIEYLGTRSQVLEESLRDAHELDGGVETLRGYVIRVNWNIPEAIRQSQIEGIRVSLGKLKTPTTIQPYRVDEYTLGSNIESTELFIRDWSVEEEGHGSQRPSFSTTTRYYVVKVAAARSKGILSNESPLSDIIELGNGIGVIRARQLSAPSPLKHPLSSLASTAASSFDEQSSILGQKQPSWRLFVMGHSKGLPRISPSGSLPKDFEFLLKTDNSSIDFDLIHKDFIHHVNPVSVLYSHYRSEMIQLMNEHGQYDEIEVVTGCVLIEQVMKIERDSRDRLASAFREFKLTMTEYVQELLENVDENGRVAIASAAYVIAHRERVKALDELKAHMGQHRRVDVFGRVNHENDNEDDDEEFDYGDDSNVVEASIVRSRLRYSLSFPWILFRDLLLKMKAGDL